MRTRFIVRARQRARGDDVKTAIMAAVAMGVLWGTAEVRAYQLGLDMAAIDETMGEACSMLASD